MYRSFIKKKKAIFKYHLFKFCQILLRKKKQCYNNVSYSEKVQYIQKYPNATIYV